MLSKDRIRKDIKDGLEGLGIEIKADDFNAIWDFIIGAIISEITTNGEVVDKDNPSTQIGIIK